MTPARWITVEVRQVKSTSDETPRSALRSGSVVPRAVMIKPSRAMKPFPGDVFMLGIKLEPRGFLERVAQELGRIDPVEVKALADAIFECYQLGRFVFLCGNGGSGSNCSHLCEDLGKCTLLRADYDN